MFAIRQAKPHAERKRIFAHAYSKSTIDTSTELREVLNAIGHDRLESRLRELAKIGSNANVFSLTREYSMDVVTAYIYGLDKGTDFLDNPVKASHYLAAFQATVDPWPVFVSSEIPRAVNILGWFGINLVSPSVLSSLQTIQSFVLELTAGTISTLQAKNDDQGASSYIFRQLWRRLDNVPEKERVYLLACDMIDQIHAGHQGTGIALTYLMWELSKKHDIQERLRAELRSLKDAGQTPERSGFLDDVLMETLRVHPVGGGPFPRVAPTDAKIAGFAIPPQTIVGASQCTLGRNSDVFPDPESWLPERWGQATFEGRRQMKQWVWPFTSGSRSCIGEHLAMLCKCSPH